ncbi:MAG: sensor domain-containing diguanylate cyclase [Acidobacteria bacterium]|nr:sensor domain-containing diguanylate cyclase [Acidobacteriota bacterium]
MQVDYQALLANTRDGIYFTDTDRRITYWNASAERITGFSAQEVVGSRCADNILIHVDEQGRNLCESLCPLAASMQDAVAREVKVYLHHKLGHRIPVLARVTPLRDNTGNVVGGAEFFTDISNQEIIAERLQELEQLALLDALTRLPNRHHLFPELTSRFHEKNRLNLNFGLIFIDLDRFKNINDAYGHDVGDRMLITIANTLKVSVRPFDLVGRWGGDEFLCIVRNADEGSLKTMAHRLLVMLNASTVPVDGNRLRITASLGATLARDGDTSDTLIKRADGLMYASKQNGRSQVTFG